MTTRKNIFVIIGSASEHSANQKIIENLAVLTQNDLHFTIFNELKALPHFSPEQSLNKPPKPITRFRNAVEQADGVIICTPEYVFSIPSGLKNAIEWCVATTVFTNKPTGLITASAHGEKGHDQLQAVMDTLMTKFTKETTLLIQGVKAKLDPSGEIKDLETLEKLKRFIAAFKELLDQNRTKISS